MNIVYQALKLIQQEGVTQSAFSFSSKTESISEKYKGFSMNRAILDILSNSDKYLSGKQIYDEMIKNGFESASGDIKRDVYISMYRPEKDGKVITRKHENRKKYMIKQTAEDL
jgi:repressor of nif and glnA expression